ncbi:hypothetical protein J2X71_006454 [Rhizobium sp. 1399]|nr:hypothetical protein [Rhizobium sp. 1399]
MDSTTPDGQVDREITPRDPHSQLWEICKVPMMELIFASHLVRPITADREQVRRPLVRWRMTVDLRELIDQLRDPRRIYPALGDGLAADKVATLLEHAIA